MNEIITPDGLARALAEATRTMTEEVIEEIEKGLNQIAKETVDELKRTSPVYKGNDKNRKYKKGTYSKSWTYFVTKGRGVIRITVYAKNGQDNLTHLLEHGHLVKDGTGRVLGNASPIPHIAEAEKHSEEKIDRLLEEL